MKIIRRIIVIIVILLALAGLGYLAVMKMYPVKYKTVIETYSREYGLREELVFGVILTESGFRADAVSNKSAYGLMQLVKQTADWGAEQTGMADYDFSRVLEPDINIRLGCWYLARLIKQFGSEETALAAYNAGSGNVASWLRDSAYSSDGATLDSIPYKETENFVKKVMNSAKIYGYILKFKG